MPRTMLAHHNWVLFYLALVMVCFHQMEGTMLFNVNTLTSLCMIVAGGRGTPGIMDYMGRFCPKEVTYLFQAGGIYKEMDFMS